MQPLDISSCMEVLDAHSQICASSHSINLIAAHHARKIEIEFRLQMVAVQKTTSVK